MKHLRTITIEDNPLPNIDRFEPIKLSDRRFMSLDPEECRATLNRFIAAARGKR